MHRFAILYFRVYFSVVALDLRGYNETDKPSGVSNYELELLAKDVSEAIEKLGGKAILIGHDWGAAISCVLAMTRGQFNRSCA